jgi:hypothetical protein
LMLKVAIFTVRGHSRITVMTRDRSGPPANEQLWLT